MGARASYAVGRVGSDSTTLVLPTDLRLIGQFTPVILCAGHGATAWQMFTDPYTGHFVRPLIDQGRAVLCIQAGGGTAWGNAAALSAIDAARTYLGTLGAPTSSCVVGGFSMGGLAALNYARQNPTEVVACPVFCAVVDLQWEHTNTAWASEIETAYGGAGWLTASADYDPARTTHPAGVPTKLWYSTNDTSAGSSAQTSWLAANPSVAGVSMGAVGHTPLPVPANDVRDFIASVL